MTNFSQTWHLRRIQDAIFVLQLFVALCFFMSFLPAVGTIGDPGFGCHRGNRAGGVLWRILQASIALVSVGSALSADVSVGGGLDVVALVDVGAAVFDIESSPVEC